jgi:hypothetical protein
MTGKEQYCTNCKHSVDFQYRPMSDYPPEERGGLRLLCTGITDYSSGTPFEIMPMFEPCSEWESL